jgi:hypothetical protein
VAKLYLTHTREQPPYWAVGLTRLDMLREGEHFITPGGSLGYVLIPVDSAGKVFIAVSSIDFEGPARGELLVRRDS